MAGLDISNRGIIGLQLQGDKKLLKAFFKIDGMIAGQISANGTKAAAQIVLDNAKTMVPVDSGRLRQSLKLMPPPKSKIKKVAKGQKTSASLYTSVATGTRKQLGISTTAKGFYPMAIEIGYTPKGGGQKVKPVPYLRESLFGNRQRLRNAMSSSMRSDITAAVLRVGSK